MTCGEGEKRRKRTCDLNLDKNYGEKSPCPGLAEQVETCQAGTCPAWTEWTDWTQCSQSCGGGIRNKVRECVLPKLGGERGCVGEAEVKEECNNEECPVWTEWTDWTMCSKTCGGGSRTKVRFDQFYKILGFNFCFSDAGEKMCFSKDWRGESLQWRS